MDLFADLFADLLAELAVDLFLEIFFDLAADLLFLGASSVFSSSVVPILSAVFNSSPVCMLKRRLNRRLIAEKFDPFLGDGVEKRGIFTAFSGSAASLRRLAGRGRFEGL